jgi:acetamidase/formamidase
MKALYSIENFHITTANGPDLYANAQNAARYMIDWIVENHVVASNQAYVLCSIAGDLVISEIVDAPNFIISLYMLLGIFLIEFFLGFTIAPIKLA